MSRPTMAAIESGAPSTAIGSVFTAATLLGVPLFDDDARSLAERRAHGEQLKALLPARVRPTTTEFDDDF